MIELADFASYDGLGLARLLEGRAVTSRELGQCVFNGIAATNSALNAVVETYEDALEGLSLQSDLEPFHAVPTLTKDFPVDAGRRGELGGVFTKGLRPDQRWFGQSRQDNDIRVRHHDLHGILTLRIDQEPVESCSWCCRVEWRSRRGGGGRDRTLCSW